MVLNDIDWEILCLKNDTSALIWLFHRLPFHNLTPTISVGFLEPGLYSIYWICDKTGLVIMTATAEVNDPFGIPEPLIATGPSVLDHLIVFIELIEPGEPATYTLTYSGTSFKSGVQNDTIITVPVGSTVEVYVKLTVTGDSASGTLSVEIRRDIVWLPDVVHTVLTEVVNLSAGEHWVHVGSFTVTDPTGTLPGQVRQYFNKVYWDGICIFDPTDPNTRPHVTT
jgi:hypothetical protein